jgi:hypothetical protein
MAINGRPKVKVRSGQAPVRPVRGPTYDLRPADPRPVRGPRWWLLRLVPLGLVLALVGLASWWVAGPPTSLDAAVLRGDRQVQGPVCLETLVDWSGSMDDHQPERRDALDALNRFARRELLPDDVYMEVAFGADAAVTVPATRFADRDRADLLDGGIDRDGTAIVPAVRASRDGRSGAAARCAARAAVIISDGIVSDVPGDLAAALQAADYTRVFLVTPGYFGRPTAFAGPELAGVVVKHFWDAARLGVVYADVIASVTGQSVGHRR